MATSFGTDPDSAQRWVRAWSASSGDRAARAYELSERVAGLSVSAKRSDGAVEVTVDGSGAVTDLRLSELVRKWPADVITSEILTAMRSAQAMLPARVADLAAQIMDADSPTTRAVVASFGQRFPAPIDAPASDTPPGATGAAAGASSSDWRRRAR